MKSGKKQKNKGLQCFSLSVKNMCKSRWKQKWILLNENEKSKLYEMHTYVFVNYVHLWTGADFVTAKIPKSVWDDYLSWLFLRKEGVRKNLWPSPIEWKNLDIQILLQEGSYHHGQLKYKEK